MNASTEWVRFDGRPRSLSGTRLIGNRLMRLVYLDEAGISASEPVTVVAGVIVHADRQFRSVAARIHDLIAEYVPPDKRRGYSFHAKELVNGGTTFPREDKRRLELLWELATIPYQLQLPVVVGFARKLCAPTAFSLLDDKKKGELDACSSLLGMRHCRGTLHADIR